MGAIHPANFMYFPPPLVDEPSRSGLTVTRYKSLSYAVDPLFESTDTTNQVRIFYLHGNNGDIFNTYDMRMHFLNNLNGNLPKGLQGLCDIQLITIDYPTFGLSAKEPRVLGTRQLDYQIHDLFQSLKTDTGGLNIVWSYSIGTRYAARLLLNGDSIDFAYMQAPYYSIPQSCTHLFSGFCTGEEGEGVSVIQQPMNILFHLAECDEIFPPSVSMDLLKGRTSKGYIMQKGATHNWFNTLQSAEIAATIIGKEIGDLFFKKLENQQDSPPSSE
jgi:hypothetical protein